MAAALSLRFRKTSISGFGIGSSNPLPNEYLSRRRLSDLIYG
jgi:hypothetical protein